MALFTDLVGSTETNTASGDEAAMAVLRAHREIVSTAAHEHGGVVVKSTGDGFLVRFSDCAEALAAALEMRARDGAVRYGVNVGAATEDGGDLYGQAVTAAARIASKAAAGEVLVSAAVKDAAAGATSARFADRGRFWLKGFPDPWQLFEVVPKGAEPSASPLAAGRTSFVARQDERIALRQRAADASGGAGSMITLVGPKGVGKSRLAQEAGHESIAQGMRTVFVRIRRSERSAALVPVRSLFQRLWRSMTDDRFRVVLGDDAGEVSRLLPEIRGRFPDVPPPPDLPPDEGRRLFFGALVRVLARGSASRPMVIVLDDLSFLDRSSADFLEHLVPTLTTSHLLVIGTYAPEELTPSAPVHATLSRLHRSSHVDTLAVAPLDRDGVAAFLAAATGTDVPDPIVDHFHAVTAGETYFLEELLRDLDSRDALFRRPGVWRPADDLLGEERPESLRLVIEDRLRRLGAAAREVLTVLAVAERSCPMKLVRSVVAQDEDVLVAALDEAAHAHAIVTSTRDGEEQVELASDLAGQFLVAGLPLLARQRLHLAVADAIDADPFGTLDERAIARHLDAAGRLADPAETGRHLRIAGLRALEAYGFEEAMSLLDRSLAVDRAMDPEQTASVLGAMASAARSLGHYDEAIDLWGQAIDLFEQVGDGASAARMCLEAANQVGQFRRGSELRGLIDRGLRLAEEDDHAVRGTLTALAGGMATQMTDLALGSRLLAEAGELTARGDDPELAGVTESARMMHHFACCEYQLAVAAGERSVELLRSRDDRWELATSLGYLATSLGWLGRFDEAETVGAEAEEIALRLENWAAYVFAEQARAFTRTGHDPSAVPLRARGQHILELAERTGFPWLAAIGHARVGLADFWSGEWQDAIVEIEAAWSAEGRRATGGHFGRLALVHAHLGDRDRTVELLDACRDDFADATGPNTSTAWTLTGSAIEAYALVGERDAAATLYPVAAALAATGTRMRSWDLRLVETQCGIAAACAAEWELAAEHFETARRHATAMPMVLEGVEVERFATLTMAGGPSHLADDARGRLAAVVHRYEEWGMRRHRQLADELLR